jgi:flap endonuclease-1
MGIKYLNKYLINNCSNNAIHKCSISEFEGKIIAIDISIYLYKYIGKNALLENIFLMISTMKYYNIIPVFIFDGKPPAEKRELLYQRKIKKKEAEKEYNELQLKMTSSDDTGNLSQEELLDIQEKMDYLKTQFIRISDSDIKDVKLLIKACGVEYYEAEGEADILCCQMVLYGDAWACMSDDMDMFVYGCPRVIRQISLMNHTCMFYDMDIILKDLNISMELFRQIMVLSGTDYNVNEHINLHETMNWYKEYQNYLKNNNKNMSFYNWLLKYTKYIKNIVDVMKTYQMFIINNNNNFNNKKFEIKKEKREDLMKILLKEGFI